MPPASRLLPTSRPAVTQGPAPHPLPFSHDMIALDLAKEPANV